MTIVPFPHQYVVSLQDGELAAPPRTAIRVGAPPQFGGSEGVWSPEELLVGAAMTCLQTTFEAYARRDKLEILRWRTIGTGLLDRGPLGPVFTEILLEVEVETAPGTEAQAAGLVRRAEQHCIISRALACPVRVVMIDARPQRAAG
jgi:organic hydroperoxide reductase OsmC/OhrA